MAEDGEVLRQIWDSHLPVSFHLSPNDLYSMKSPEPYYSMVPRLSYFSLIIDRVVVYFSQFIDLTTKSAANLWLDFLGIPLKLNYPIGLLYDLYSPDIELPWSITVNFDNFPSDQIVRCNTRVSMESTYMYSLKEADVLKHKNSLVNTMQKRDHTQLWNGILNYKFDQFWSINRRLMHPDPPVSSFSSSGVSPTPTTESNTATTTTESDNHNSNNSSSSLYFRHIPFRVYIVNTKGDAPLFYQKLIKPTLDQGEARLLRHLLEEVLKVKEGEQLEKRYRVVMHGIEPPLDTPLQWMSEHLSYLDNFLHISVFERR